MAKKTNKIVNTISQRVNIDVYTTDKLGNKSSIRRLSIGGGANVWDGIQVPSGTGILVDDEELGIIRSNPVFKAFEESGYVVVSKINDSQEKIIEGMTEKDSSAQRTPSDIEDKRVKVVNRNGEVLVEVPEKEEEIEKITVSTKKRGSKKSKK